MPSLVTQIQADLAECQLHWATSRRSLLEPQFLVGTMGTTTAPGGSGDISQRV